MVFSPVEIFDSSFGGLERAMQVATQRQMVIAQNIANAKTPGYRAMTFDEQLMKAVERAERRDVVLEDELSALTENSVKYSAVTKLMTAKLNVLKTIVTQGRR
ncbi:MAG: flagellar basal body protein [Candidatus Margulisbacteria bacterium]|jgi:flagellar basal body rod protein FlgB|nr:flagellar basal body protein [Candidatus Margulisiibacteriota bacterium]